MDSGQMYINTCRAGRVNVFSGPGQASVGRGRGRLSRAELGNLSPDPPGTDFGRARDRSGPFLDSDTQNTFIWIFDKYGQEEGSSKTLQETRERREIMFVFDDPDTLENWSRSE